MEYLKPIELLQQTVKRYQITVISLCAVLACAVIFGPLLAKSGNPLLLKTDAGVVLAEVDPWKLSVTRLELFAKTYLANRFEWKTESFKTQKENLKHITTDQVFSKLRESLSSFESMVQGENAKSYFVLEDFGFSNAQKKMEIHITRILRINNAAIATPLRILLSYQEAGLSEANPFGLLVTGVDESDINEVRKTKEGAQ